jgi:hypothetical protein
MEERRIGALEATAETDCAQFFGAGIAPKRPRDAGAEPDAMRLAGGLTGRIGASSHLVPVRRGALGGGWATSRVRHGRVLSGTAPWRIPLGEPPPTRVGCRRPSPRRRVSRLRGRRFSCDFGVACKISRLARGAISSSAPPAAPRKRQSATYGVPRLHTTDRVREADAPGLRLLDVAPLIEQPPAMCNRTREVPPWLLPATIDVPGSAQASGNGSGMRDPAMGPPGLEPGTYRL